MTTVEYTTEDLEVNGTPRLGIRLAAYPDVSFVVGAVELLEEDDQLRLKYQWDLVEGTPPDTNAFKNAVGDFVLDYITHQGKELIYTGGT